MRIATFVWRKTSALALIATLLAVAFVTGAEQPSDNQPHKRAVNRTNAYLSN